jgi:hypothetical protein
MPARRAPSIVRRARNEIRAITVGFGVCLHAGAVFGCMWNEWRDEQTVVAED